MKAVSQDYKNEIKEFGKQIDNQVSCYISGVYTILGNDELISVSLHYEGELLKSVMKQLDIKSTVNIPVGTKLGYKFGVKIADNEVLDYRDNYEYIDYGNFYVYSSEKNQDTNSYSIVCYDGMLNAMKSYFTPRLYNSDRTYYTEITYPITIRNYLFAICSTMDVYFVNQNDNFINWNVNINKELYLKDDGGSLAYTFRDVLDEIAQITASTIIVDENGLELKYIDNDFTPFYKYKTLNEMTGSSAITFNQSVKTSGGVAVQTPQTFRVKFKINENFTSLNIINDNNNQISITPTGVYVNGSLYYNYTFNTNTEYSIGFRERRLYINDTAITGYGISQLPDVTFINPFIFGVTNVTIIGAIRMGYYSFAGNRSIVYGMYYDIDTNNPVLIYAASNYTDIIATNYTNETPTPTQVETIDTDYFKDTNVGFNSLYGPINTITFIKQSENEETGDKTTSLSIPNNLATDLKNEIVISNNQILNANPYINYILPILNKIYGISYYTYDCATTGITWLEMCDKFNVEITTLEGTTNTYPCVLLNDDIQINSGLAEHIYIPTPEKSESSFNTLTQYQRQINRQTIINISQEELSEKKKTLTLSNEWIMGYKASGDNFCVIIPFENPENEPVIVSITSAEVYSGGWQTLTYVGVLALKTFIKLSFSTDASLTNGNVYLCRIDGKIYIN